MHVPRSPRAFVSSLAGDVTGSVKYALSDLRQLLIGGLLVITSVALIGLPLLLGYITLCIREQLSGQNRLPAFTRLTSTYLEGMKISFLGIEYFLLTVIACDITLRSLSGLFTHSQAMALRGELTREAAMAMHPGTPAALLLAIFLLFFCTAWIMYAVNGRVFSAMNPLAVMGWIVLRPALVLRSAVMACITLILLAIPGVLIFTLPWALFACMAGFAAVNARSYDQWTKRGDPVVAFITRSTTRLFNSLKQCSVPCSSGNSSRPGLLQNLGDAARLTLQYLLGRVECSIKSLKYSLSDMDLVFWGGISVMLSYALVGFPLLFGYLSRCLREVMKGNSKLPPFDRKREMAFDGLKVSLIGLEYLALTGLLFWVTSPLFNLPGIGAMITDFSGTVNWLAANNLGLVLPTIIHGFIFGVFFNNAWLRYVVTGKLLSSLNPFAVLRWIFTYPEMIFNNMLTTGLAGLVLAVPGLFVVMVPWLTFVGFATNAYIRGESYENMVTTGGIRKTVLSGGLSNALVRK